MSSFACPHFDGANNWCLRLNADCVPGRRGCVLAGKATFVLPPEERVRALEEEKRQARMQGSVADRPLAGRRSL
jgi:hypothetical protein